jgi:hypothetical protein
MLATARTLRNSREDAGNIKDVSNSKNASFTIRERLINSPSHIKNIQGQHGASKQTSCQQHQGCQQQQEMLATSGMSATAGMSTTPRMSATARTKATARTANIKKDAKDAMPSMQ